MQTCSPTETLTFNKAALLETARKGLSEFYNFIDRVESIQEAANELGRTSPSASIFLLLGHLLPPAELDQFYDSVYSQLGKPAPQQTMEEAKVALGKLSPEQRQSLLSSF